MKKNKPDPRLNAFRPDLAATYLKDQVEAEHFCDGQSRSVTASSAPLRRGPGHVFALDSELLFGERVTLFDEHDGWAWCQSDVDDYVGYVPFSALGPVGLNATHMVSALCSHAYLEPDIKSPPIARLKMNALVSVIDEHERFSVLANSGGYVFSGHLDSMKSARSDFISIAENFMGTPYLWGGRTNNGLDCSALVQLSLHAIGKVCPRDSDMQAGSLGHMLDFRNGFGDLRRGDLVFWNGHVGIMQSTDLLLHATAHYMMVVVEPLLPAIERIKKAGSGDVTAVRRL